MEKYVCNNHIEDEAIKKYIKTHSHVGKCDYCTDARDRRVIALDDLGEFMTDAIGYYYDEAGNALGWNGSEGGFIGSHFDTYDLLWEELGLSVEDSTLQDDLVSVLPDTVWCYQDPYGLNKGEELYYDWEYFKNIVKHKARHCFFFLDKAKDDFTQDYLINVSDILEEISNLITKYKLIKKLPSQTVFFRCRQHKTMGEVSTTEHIVSPPLENAIFSNRMTPAGISMFYAGFDINTAIKETVIENHTEKPYYTVGEFSSINETLVVDFSALPATPSIFDIDKQADYYPIRFLRKLVADLVKKVEKDGREHIEYVPTQIVTEYIRYILSKNTKYKVGGIIYPSAKVRRQNACVLFLDNKECLRELQFNSFVLTDNEVVLLDPNLP